MVDVEKVIKGLNCHINHDCRGNSCPYANNDACASDLFLDAIELLKEYAEIKNGVAPELEGDPGNGYWDVCGECHVYLSGNETYCKCCGRKVLWDAKQRNHM